MRFAQDRPDFSGVWAMDSARSEATGVYGQVRVIRQATAEINLAILHHAGKSWNVIPWRLRINRWGPRRGGDQSREPIVQARWDGEKLIVVKSPGQSYSTLWIYSLLAGRQEMLVEAVNWTSIPWDFDFREKSIPRAYARNRYVYVKSDETCTDCFFGIGQRGVYPAPDNDTVVFQLTNARTEVSAKCQVDKCVFVDIEAGRQGTRRTSKAGGVVSLALSAQTLVEVPK